MSKLRGNPLNVDVFCKFKFTRGSEVESVSVSSSLAQLPVDALHGLEAGPAGPRHGVAPVRLDLLLGHRDWKWPPSSAHGLLQSVMLSRSTRLKTPICSYERLWHSHHGQTQWTISIELLSRLKGLIWKKRITSLATTNKTHSFWQCCISSIESKVYWWFLDFKGWVKNHRNKTPIFRSNTSKIEQKQNVFPATQQDIEKLLNFYK